MTKLTPTTRQELIHAISHGMQFDGRKRIHNWDGINAKVAAEKLVDYLARSNFVVIRGPPAMSASEAHRSAEVSADPELPRELESHGLSS